jgi:hypothetical protein
MGRRTQRLLLLGALVLSIIGMHHLVLSPDRTPHVTMSAAANAVAPAAMSLSRAATPEASSADDHATGGLGHDMMLPHPCLVVLCAAAKLLLIAWLSVAVGAGSVPAFAARLLTWVRRAWRPPGTAGRPLLTSLCVMRT